MRKAKKWNKLFLAGPVYPEIYFNISGNIFRISGNIFHISGNIFRISGNIFLVKLLTLYTVVCRGVMSKQLKEPSALYRSLMTEEYFLVDLLVLFCISTETR